MTIWRYRIVGVLCLWKRWPWLTESWCYRMDGGLYPLRWRIGAAWLVWKHRYLWSLE